MAAQEFWNEEIREYPHGGQGAAVWVVRREGNGARAPLRILFAWDTGTAREEGLARRPPLGVLLRSLEEGREELVRRGPDTALWVEPVLDGGRPAGCVAVWFEAAEPWRENIFLWGQRLAARVAPVLAHLEPWTEPSAPPGARAGQQLLFPLPDPVGTPAAPVPSRCLPLPRPVTVPGIPGCVGTSREMHRLGRTLGAIARSGVNVLLKGESGTGKEVVARALHLRSERARGPFVGQNCAALPETLFESELFGHRAGAFTGATGEKKGLLAAASGGTFFLDEIGDMPLALQIKLLRTMQEGSVRRIGELRARPVDIRFLAASHKDLPAEITAGRFRLDLYYRLKVVCLEIPALRHRPEDVAHLFAYFLRKAGRPIADMRITERALSSLQAWRWPGNVRELENEVKRFVALYPEATVVRLHQLSAEVRTARTGRVDAADLGTLRQLGQANEILEKYLIRKAIAATAGRKAAAARCLGLSRQGLYKKIARYGMTDLIGSGED